MKKLICFLMLLMVVNCNNPVDIVQLTEDMFTYAQIEIVRAPKNLYVAQIVCLPDIGSITVYKGTVTGKDTFNLHIIGTPLYSTITDILTSSKRLGVGSWSDTNSFTAIALTKELDYVKIINEDIMKVLLTIEDYIL